MSGKSKVESTSRVVPPILIGFVILVFGFTLNSLKIVPFTLISLEKPESMLIDSIDSYHMIWELH